MNRFTLFLILPAALAFSTAAGLRAAPPKTRDRIEILEQKQDELFAALEGLREENARLRLELQRVSEVTEQLRTVATRIADVGTQAESLGTDVRSLFENVNDLDSRLSRMEERLQTAIRSFQAPVDYERPQDPEAAAVLPATGSPASGAPTGAATPGGPSGASGTAPSLPPGVSDPVPPPGRSPRAVVTDPEPLFQSAYADYARGNYELALGGFQEYVERFPNLKQTDDALFWMGESQYALGSFEQAIASYDRVSKETPQGDKVPDARLKKGMALFEVNRILEGTRELRGVIRDFPDTPAARAACQRLKEMRLDC